MLRSRDIVAVLLAVVLARMAWTTSGPDADASASLRLAFYAPSKLAAPLDVDGDGILEAMAVISTTDESTKLQVLDLKPLHASSRAAAPFVPQVLFQTQVDSAATPMELKTGQIIWNHHYHHRHHHAHHARATGHAKKDTSTSDSDDRSRHFFCGSDWHDAANNCRQHCPSGSSGDCPSGETCYADTPCDALREQRADAEAQVPQNYTLTPAGGLPTIITYWSDGTLTVHTLSATTPGQPLELQLLWQTNLKIELEEVHVDLLASEDVRSDDVHLGQHGMILVGGTYVQEDDDQVVSVMVAWDAMTGEQMWSTAPKERAELGDNKDDADEPLLQAMRGNRSAARRRSQIVSVQQQEHAAETTELPNCLQAFKQLLKKASGALPHSYWGPPDVHVTPLHLHRHKHQRHSSKTKPVHGRPNALLGHYRDGIHIRSLLNGRALCHVSLNNKVVYADLNQDGILDHVQVVTNNNEDDNNAHNQKWIQELTQQLQQEDALAQQRRKLPKSNRLCHVLALSGLPSRELLFYGDVCGKGIAREHADHATIDLVEAPPLVVDDTDVIIALNNGRMSRYHVPSGKRTWQSQVKKDVTWSPDSMAASLSILQSKKGRTLLLTGDNGMILSSLRSGVTLASANFPQSSLGRPIVADVSGDGIPDVMIQSADAIWGYHVAVQSGASTLFRILVGLLLMGIALALLRNRAFGKSDKRSTDA